MCGRFTLQTIHPSFLRTFGQPEIQLPPRYNIAPAQLATVVLNDSTQSRYQSLTWGLVPFWTREKMTGRSLINARAETLMQKRAFRAAYRRRRCLVPADGFFEWKREGRKKTPYYFTMSNPNRPMALAGIWEDWTDGTEHIRSFAIITTEANTVMAPIHKRMPVMVGEEKWEEWLGGADPQSVESMLNPIENGALQCREVGPYVNSALNEGMECIRTAEAPSPNLFTQTQNDRNT